jgi:hypothetical protein
MKLIPNKPNPEKNPDLFMNFKILMKKIRQTKKSTIFSSVCEKQ